MIPSSSSILSSSARPPDPRNFNTVSPRHTLSSFYPLWNPWNPLPPSLPLLSLTCQVDMSSSPAPPGVSVPHLFPFSPSLICQNRALSIPACLVNALHCQSQSRHRRRLRDRTCPSWCCALPRPSWAAGRYATKPCHSSCHPGPRCHSRVCLL